MDMVSKILIFRTSISKKQDIKLIAKVLNKCTQIENWNVDFEDWEKVLRIECHNMNAIQIAAILREIGIYAEELE